MMTNPARTALVLLVFALFGLQDTEEITCKNEEGDAVDWFIFYKLPKRLGKEHADSGREYLYLDSTMRTWRKGQHLVNSNRSMLARTLEPLYEANISQSNNTAYLIYNDGVPKSTNYSKKYGHTKGLLVWNRIKGFWLIHSVPRFPQIPEDGYDYPSSGERYGQSGICITFKYNQYEVIDSQLLVLQPNIYSCSIPDVFHWELIHIPNLCNKTSSFTIPSRHITVLQSEQELNFFHFAKSSSYTNGMKGYHHVSGNRVNWLEKTLWLFRTEKWERRRLRRRKRKRDFSRQSHSSLFHTRAVADNHRSTSYTYSWGARNSVSFSAGHRATAISGTHQTVSEPSSFSSLLYNPSLHDIFTDWMAQHLKTHLLVETWHQKSHELPSNCSLPYHVYNINLISPESKYYFASHQDHSKWCVSRRSSKNHWTCIGDLNRDPHQAFRAGGFICTKNRYIYHAFYKLVSHYEPCN